MNKFKVGDRIIAHYLTSSETVNSIKGIIKQIDRNIITFEGPYKSISFAHYKQCRKLVPKKLKEGSNIWVAAIVKELTGNSVVKISVLGAAYDTSVKTTHSCIKGRKL